MKTFLADIIPKIQRYSQKLDNLSLLTNQHWVILGELANAKVVYIFRSNNDLLVSNNGRVEKAKWEYLGQNTLLIDRSNESFLFRHGFLDENILALKLDSKEEYAFMVNESKYESEINSIEKAIDFLRTKYLDQEVKAYIPGLKKNNKLLEPTEGTDLIKRELKLEDGRNFEYFQNIYLSQIIGCSVLINGEIPEDCFVTLKNQDKKFEIKDGVIHQEYYYERIKQKNGSILKIEANRTSGISVGSLAWLNDKPAPDGIYNGYFFKKFNVKNGKIC